MAHPLHPHRGQGVSIETLHPKDLAAIENARAEADIMVGMTKGQRARQRIRFMVERGGFSPAELSVLCSCARPNCVVHAKEYTP